MTYVNPVRVLIEDNDVNELAWKDAEKLIRERPHVAALVYREVRRKLEERRRGAEQPCEVEKSLADRLALCEKHLAEATKKRDRQVLKYEIAKLKERLEAVKTARLRSAE